jgi:hypothetical protein
MKSHTSVLDVDDRVPLDTLDICLKLRKTGLHGLLALFFRLCVNHNGKSLIIPVKLRPIGLQPIKKALSTNIRTSSKIVEYLSSDVSCLGAPALDIAETRAS